MMTHLCGMLGAPECNAVEAFYVVDVIETLLSGSAVIV
jgi:hypothetical protein